MATEVEFSERSPCRYRRRSRLPVLHEGRVAALASQEEGPYSVQSPRSRESEGRRQVVRGLLQGHFFEGLGRKRKGSA